MAAAKSRQSCPTLCDPIDSSPPGSLVPGILQARTLEWVAISFFNGKMKRESEVAQLCPTLRDPMNCSLPGSSVHGSFQARVLEWAASAVSNHLKHFNQLSCLEHSHIVTLLSPPSLQVFISQNRHSVPVKQ